MAGHKIAAKPFGRTSPAAFMAAGGAEAAAEVLRYLELLAFKASLSRSESLDETCHNIHKGWEAFCPLSGRGVLSRSFSLQPGRSDSGWPAME